MKNSIPTFRAATLALAALLWPTLGHAQTNEVYDGGTGTWDTVPSNLVWDGGMDAWVNGNDAQFNRPTNDVTVSGTVTSSSIEIDDPTTISGGTIDQLAEDRYSPTILKDFSSGAVTVSSEIVLSDMGNGTLDGNNNNTQNGYINNYGTANLSLGSIDWGAYTINTDLNTSGQGTPEYDNHGALRVLNIDASGAGASVTFNGDYTNDEYAANPNNTGSSINLGNGGDDGTYTISSTANFANFVPGGPDTNAIYLSSGILNIDNSTFNGDKAPTAVDGYGANPVEAWIGATANATAGYSTINLVGSQTIYMQAHINPANNGTYGSDGADLTGATTFQQSGPGSSVWEGTPGVSGYAGSGGEIHMNGGNVIFGATTVNSRLNINSDVGGSGAAGVDFTGPGVVVLSNPGGNDYNEKDDQGNLQASSTVAATIESGATVLITNTSGSAFGGTFDNYSNYSVNGSAADHATYQPFNVRGNGNDTGITNQVNLNAGGTLGGTGISTNPIVAEDATSIIAPGDPGQAGLGILPSIGTLHLDGGVTAANGLTLDFKLDGAVTNAYDVIDFGGSTLAVGPSGTITFNFTNLGGDLSTDTNYTILTGLTGGFTASSFVFNAPTGYTVDLNNENSYSFNSGDFIVQFELAPEPSTYGLLGLGLVALVAIGRFRRLNS